MRFFSGSEGGMGRIKFRFPTPACGVLLLVLLMSCGRGGDSSSGTWVEGSVDSRGRFRKGHFRKKVSTSPNAFKNRARSNYYYHTRGKYRRKSK